MNEVKSCRGGIHDARSSGRGKPRPYACGFTLVELIITLLILGFISAAVITSFPDFTTIRVNYAANKIQSDIRYVQQYAISTQLRTRLTFDAAADEYLGEYETAPPLSENWTSLNDPLTKQKFQVALNTGEYAGVDITGVTLGAGSVLIFNGAPNNVGEPFTQGNVALVGTGSVQLNGKTINISEKTGKVEIV